MSIIRGCIDISYGRRGINAPQENTVGGTWPFIKCECGKWLNPETKEHCKEVNLLDFLKQEKIECPDNE